MRILITNDDGIEAPGIRALTAWARKLGDVTVVAPKSEQSAKSQSIQLHQPFEALPRPELFQGIEAWHVDSTPADCIRFAFLGLERSFDLVFSGINSGYNLGGDIAYSGTVGAILEASVVNIPAVAFSTDFRAIDAAAPQLDDVWDYFTRHRLLEKHTLYNVNIPTVPAKGARITRQGGVYFSDVYREVSPGMYQAVGKPVCERYATLERDIDAVLEGYISVMPLTVDRTDYRVYPELLRTVGI